MLMVSKWRIYSNWIMIFYYDFKIPGVNYFLFYFTAIFSVLIFAFRATFFNGRA